MIMKIDGEQLNIMVREKRLQARLSQVELSSLSGVSRTCISEVEHGKYIPSIILLLKLARALNCSLNELVLTGGLN